MSVPCEWAKGKVNMVVKRMDKANRVAEGFSGARSALEEVFHYYKFGRHVDAFPEKPYFLLSRCTRVLFSLWPTEQESTVNFFQATPPPAAFLAGLDFGVLRYSEYKRRMLRADSPEDHLTNETKWFEFWIRILEQVDPLGAPLYQEFSRRILTCVGHGGFLERKKGSKDWRLLNEFLKTDDVGRVLVRTMSVLEDFIRAIVYSFTTPDVRPYALQQMTLIAGLLGEMRRIIIWETPARGPYVPFGDSRWRTLSPFTWLSRDRSQGALTVVPRREGREIICTYKPASDSEGRTLSWVRRVASLKGTYEEYLFTTWSYETGEYRENPGRFPDVTACWTVQNAEAGRLEALSRQVDSLLEVLQHRCVYKRLIDAVRGLLRHGAPRWKAMTLPWTYVQELDRLLDKLTFVSREAQAIGGHDAVESIIARIWPPEEAGINRADLDDRQDRPRERTSHVSTAKDEAHVGLSIPDEPQQAHEAPEQLSLGQSTQEDRQTVAGDEAHVYLSIPDEPQQTHEAPEQLSSDQAVQEGHQTVEGDEAHVGLSIPDEPQQTHEAPERLSSDQAVQEGHQTVEGDQASENDESEVEQRMAAAPQATDGGHEPEPSPSCHPMDPMEQYLMQSVPSMPASLEQEPGSGQAGVEKGPTDEHEQRLSARQAPATEEEHQPEPAKSTSRAPRQAREKRAASEASEATVSTERPPAAEPAGSPRGTEADNDRAVVPPAREEFPQEAAHVAGATSTSRAHGTDSPLLMRLLDRHGCLGGTISYTPIAAIELQLDLGWNRSRVQRAMADVFGRKPFSTYQRLCADRTIAAFLRGVRIPSLGPADGTCAPPDGEEEAVTVGADPSASP